ncbi:uncharacterized protein BDZ99DRAFT_493278 [Mytilinidion resinicola]|uniref:Uncharacterized protein n=1 Tax=Mytilinidion resinicola TaxID=574789 RepID=A0A6A6Z9U7_9PEZI|nr:uncharacterized protein BDZ99DRAFT_493278 [Mytilinidion resinicola]KAF2817469.1 hypothetical protein BDZ99DRAFT_493278 [Mytilinidion resinicola]
MQPLERSDIDPHAERTLHAQGRGEKRKLLVLSEDTLERHNKCYRKTNEAFGKSAIRQEGALAYEEEMYHLHYGKKVVALHDGFVPGPDKRSMPPPSPPSANNMNIYSATPSSETPMRRFMFPSTAHDAQPWLARGMLEDSGIGCGDLDSLELRRLAGQVIVPDENGDETEGSLCPSSPTLSNAQAMRVVKEKQERGSKENPRVRKLIKRHRAHTSRDAQDSGNTPE